MSQAGYTPISLYYSTTVAAAPSAANLANGELAINITDGKLYYKDNGGVVQVIATKGAGTIGGSNTQVQYNSSGALAGSANLTFNGTTLTANTLNLTNALGVAYGGTGLTSGTSGGVLYYSASGTLASSAALASSAIVLGGGAGVAPATTTTGTGVVTALGVNTGTAGAFVVNGGALGTPSSGTVTNLTGTASININGTVGATTPTTGAFTTISASGVASFADGTVGTPGLNFSSDTDSGIYRIGANNIGIGVNGAKVLDISTTGTAVTGRASYSASALGTYQWDSFNPTDVAGTSTNAPSTGTTVDTDYITLANSSGTVTCTFDIAGRYLIACNGQTAHSNTYTADRITWTLGGTATRYVVANPSNSGDSANDYNMAIAVVFSVTATAAQTLTVLPKYEVVGSGTTANHQCSPQLYVTYLGG